jgi:nucleoside-diphosphate-sugar epimerase
LLSFEPKVAASLRDDALPIVVTGAGGWVGRAALEMLESALGQTMAQRVHIYGSAGRPLQLRSGTVLRCRPLRDLPDLDVGPQLLLHLAFVTKEHVGSRSLDVYQALNEEISTTVFNYGNRHEIVGMFLPSSGAVYGPEGILARDVASNPYGALKLRDEERLGGLADRSAIIRVFNLAGPFLNKPQHYVLGSVLTDLAAGGPIRLHSDHPVIRSFVHVADLVDVAFAIMLGIASSPEGIFDTAGEREVEVGELATLAASILGHHSVVVERPNIPAGAVADRYVGDGEALESIARTYGFELATLETQITDTATFLTP